MNHKRYSIILNRRGFSLAELLIVVAIIGVLVAISIPIFTKQLEKSREATDVANLRNAKAAVLAVLYDVIDFPSDERPENYEGLQYIKTSETYEGYYNPGTGQLQSTFIACGKGTKKYVWNDAKGYDSGFDYTSDGGYGIKTIISLRVPKVQIGWTKSGESDLVEYAGIDEFEY